jgi:DNA-binding Lrp family transcriptional regulator
MELAFPSSASMASREKLSLRERDAFALMEFDPALPAERVAKQLRSTAATVNYTLRRLIDREIIRPRCFINSYKLGFLDVGFFFSLSEQSPSSREKLILRFQEDPSVAYFGSVLGDYQYMAVILCRDLSDFSSIIMRLTGNHGAIVSDKRIVPRISVMRFARKYLNPKFASNKILTLARSGDIYKLDDSDEKLIWTLGNQPFHSLRQLAKSTGMPLATVDRRVKRLKSAEVIQGFFYDLNVGKLGIQSFRLLVHVQGLSCAVRRAVIALCTKHLLVVYLIEALGSWDFEIGIETSDPRLIARFVEELYAATERRISSVEILTELEDFICRHYPGKLGCGVPRA